MSKNCERLLKEYKILLNAGQIISADVVKKRIVKRYGKGVLLDSDDIFPNPSDN